MPGSCHRRWRREVNTRLRTGEQVVLARYVALMVAGLWAMARATMARGHRLAWLLSAMVPAGLNRAKEERNATVDRSLRYRRVSAACPNLKGGWNA